MILCISQISEKGRGNLKIAESMGSRDKNANVIYAETATKLFEGIANVVEVRQPLVETYFGMSICHLHVDSKRGGEPVVRISP